MQSECWGNGAPVTVFPCEIAARIFAELPPSPTVRKHTLRSVQNRVSTFLRNHRRNGDVVPIIVKGKKAQGWKWVS